MNKGAKMKIEKTNDYVNSYALNLFEKGIISRCTLAETFEINWEQECKRNAEEQKDVNNISSLNFTRQDFDRKSARIEHARRNVEVLFRALSGFKEKSYFSDKIELEILKNLDIMDEVKDL